MKLFKVNFVLSLVLALCSVNFVAAITLDELTSENVVNLTIKEFRSLLVTPVQDIVVTSSGDTEGFFLRYHQKAVVKKIIKLLNKSAIIAMSKDVRSDLYLIIEDALKIDKESAGQLMDIIAQIEASSVLDGSVLLMFSLINFVEADKLLAPKVAHYFVAYNLLRWIDWGDNSSSGASAIRNGLAKEIIKLLFIKSNETLLRENGRAVHYTLQADKSLAQQLVLLINKDTIATFNPFIISLLDADKTLAKDIAQFIDQQTIFEVDPWIIHILLKADASLAHEFASLINLEDRNVLMRNTSLLIYIASLDNVFKEKLIIKLEQKLVALGSHTSLESRFFATEINSFLDLLKFLKGTPKLVFKKSTLQSMQHFDYFYGHNSVKDVFTDLNKKLNEKDRQMLLKILHKSRVEEKKGNFTFIHAQVRSFLPLSDIFKRVVELCENNGESYAGYYPLRFTKAGGQFALNDANIATIVKHGLYKDPWTKNFDAHGVYTLCMNAFLFGSAEISGSYSLGYWVGNYDQSDNKGLNFNARKMLEAYGLEKYYDRYQNEFEALWADIMKDKQRGNILLLSLTPEQVKKWVYASHGQREKAHLKRNGHSTHDVADFLTTVKNDPSKLAPDDMRKLHYCLVLADQSMDPVKGVKIYPFTSDESYVREWREKLDDVFVKIKQDIEKEKQPVKVQPQISQNKTSSTLDLTQSSMVNRRVAVLGAQLQLNK